MRRAADIRVVVDISFVHTALMISRWRMAALCSVWEGSTLRCLSTEPRSLNSRKPLHNPWISSRTRQLEIDENAVLLLNSELFFVLRLHWLFVASLTAEGRIAEEPKT